MAKLTVTEPKPATRPADHQTNPPPHWPDANANGGRGNPAQAQSVRGNHEVKQQH